MTKPRLRRILREFAQDYHQDGFREHELAAFYAYYHTALKLPAILAVYQHTPDLRVRRAALVLVAFMADHTYWSFLREIERTTDDWLQREIATWGRRLIDPQKAALDDFFDALADYARRMIAIQPGYQPRLF